MERHNLYDLLISSIFDLPSLHSIACVCLNGDLKISNEDKIFGMSVVANRKGSGYERLG